MRIGDTVTPRVNEKDYTLPSCGFTHVVGKEKEGHGGSGESTLRCSAIESGLYENNGALGFSNCVPKISRNLLSSSNTFRAPDSFDFCNAKYEKLGA